MRTMQELLTAQAEQRAERLGLGIYATYAAGANTGTWWVLDGLDLRAQIRFDFQAGRCAFRVTGPAAWLAAERGTGIPGAHRSTSIPADAGPGWEIAADYERPGSIPAALDAIGALLTPWRTAENIMTDLGSARARLEEAGEPAFNHVGDARAAFAGGDTIAAAEHIDTALTLLPAGRRTGRDLAEIADALTARAAAGQPIRPR